MDQNEINEVVRLHGMWLRGEDGGVRANLSGVNLRGADLSSANLRGADLSRANLRGADLSRANLTEANLSWANLTEANLSWADFSWANLTEANLSDADLSWANLTEADLTWAGLSGCRGIRFAQCSWDGHGESGRMLTGALIGDDIRMFCGRFRGTVAELEMYIADGDPDLAESRTFALRFVLACLLFGGRDE